MNLYLLAYDAHRWLSIGFVCSVRSAAAGLLERQLMLQKELRIC